MLREIRKAQGFGAEQPARYQLLGEKMDPEKDELSKADSMFSPVFPEIVICFNPGS